MKILYDHQVFSFQEFGGISRYFAQIISNLPADANTSIAVKYSDNVYMKQKNLTDNLLPMNQLTKDFLFGMNFKGKINIFNSLKKKRPEKYDTTFHNKAYSIEQLKKQDFDIFHPTYYDDYFLEYIGNKPFVLTIHDMIQDLYPEMYQGHLDDNSILRQKANLVLKANHIVAVSERTKKDVIDFFDIPEEKISVIYHSSSIEQKNEQVLNLPPKYFLYFGERKRYKNFWFFVRAIEPILKSRKDIHVICTGQWLNRNELRMLYDLQILDYFTQTFVEEGNLFEVYNRAIAFVFPSYYEGFGIPILEAFESSCPVLLSDSSCFPEIAKDCALYFPPKDIKRLRFCIEEIIDKPSLRQTLIDKGEKRAKDFSWEKSAAQTHAVYERVLNNEL